MSGDGFEQWTNSRRKRMRVQTLLGQPLIALVGAAMFWGSLVPRAALIAWAAALAVPTVAMGASVHWADRDIDRSDRYALAYRLMMMSAFAAVPWLHPRLAESEPHGYLIGFIVILPTAAETISAAVFEDRRRYYALSVALPTGSATLAYLFNSEWAMAGLILAWVLIMRTTRSAGSTMHMELNRLRDAHRLDARRDELTGLLNRKGFLERLADTRSTEETWLVVVVDVDRFKLLNDSLGHHFGDKVLVEIASRLRRSLPEGSIVGRLGGDEFAALVPQRSSFTEMAELVTAAGDEVSGAITLAGVRVQVSVSTGIAPLRAGDEPLEQIAEADLAMYRRKRRRASGHTLSQSATDDTATLRSDAANRIAIESELRDALDADRLTFFAQPIVSADRQHPVAVELLARVRRLDGSLLAPEQFIPIAEETGLVVEIGRRGIATAARLADLWAADPMLQSLRIAVNISASHLGAGLDADLDRYFPKGANPLVLEFVESRLISMGGRLTDLLDALRDRGAALYIDDFGVGYSSLGYLMSLPIDGVKLDRSFLSGFTDDHVRRDLVTAIVSITDALSIPCVAEGVEDERLIEPLRQAGMSQLQGFHIGKPVELDMITPVLRSLWAQVVMPEHVQAPLFPPSPEQWAAMDQGSAGRAS